MGVVHEQLKDGKELIGGNNIKLLASCHEMLYIYILSAVVGVYSQHHVAPDIARDAHLSTPELIAEYGFKAETHHVRTVDGYILGLHRIPRGRNERTEEKRPPVLVLHGIFTSSADWVYTLPGRALGYVMADEGFDVWLGNFRGNLYSRNHSTLSTTSKEFWNFSWHENGLFDLPVMIDYILAVTGNKQLFYVGHSMGTTSLFVLMSLRPEYNDKIRLAVCMAPVAFVAHVKSKLLRRIAIKLRDDESLLNDVGTYELLPHSKIMTYITLEFCSDEALTQGICSNLLLMITGWETDQLNKTQLPVILSHVPQGASTKQLAHFAQEVISGRFCQWDYGTTKNRRYYGTLLPPQYNLSQITVPTVFFFAENDWISVQADVQRLERSLRNHVKTIVVPYKTFTHMDFVWAKDGKTLVYDSIIHHLKLFFPI